MKSKQLKLFRSPGLEHGGEHRRKSKGRGARPLSTRETIHLTLRSSRARGPMSFRAPKNAHKIDQLLEKFAAKFGVKVFSCVNNHTHLHIQMRLSNRQLYKPFIRALTAAIAMAVAGTSRWKKATEKFWDLRPFTRVAIGRKGFEFLRDYLDINRLESNGISRLGAEWVIRQERLLYAGKSGG